MFKKRNIHFMRLIVNIFLLILAAALVYLLVTSIQEPIAFQDEYSKRKSAVVSKLIQIREAQQAYRAITGEYAPTLDTLKEVLEKDSFEVVKLFGDDSDPNSFKKEISYVKAIDSIKNITYRTPQGKVVGVSLDSLGYVPFSTGDSTFELSADTITYQQTRGVPVLEVKVPVKDFMGEYADPRYKRYDLNYHPDDPAESKYYLKFGDLTKPSTSGNWEN